MTFLPFLPATLPLVTAYVALPLQKSWTLAVAAEKAQVSIAAYSRWEYRIQDPRLSSLSLLCNAFDQTPEELGFAHLVTAPLTEEKSRDDNAEETEATVPDIIRLSGVNLGIKWADC